MPRDLAEVCVERACFVGTVRACGALGVVDCQYRILQLFWYTVGTTAVMESFVSVPQISSLLFTLGIVCATLLSAFIVKLYMVRSKTLQMQREGLVSCPQDILIQSTY